MINAVVTWLSALVMRTIESSGYLGVTVLMVLESANIPIPSEIIMPFSGFLVKYGRFIFIHKRDIELADKLFARWGSSVVFFSRILPIVRTFISFPAGIARMNIWKFSFYTFAGSLIWSALLAYVGFWAGENWHFLSPYFRKFDWLIVSLVLVGTVWWVTRYVRKIRDNG